jgi:hypothetical protein
MARKDFFFHQQPVADFFINENELAADTVSCLQFMYVDGCVGASST